MVDITEEAWGDKLVSAYLENSGGSIPPLVISRIVFFFMVSHADTTNPAWLKKWQAEYYPVIIKDSDKHDLEDEDEKQDSSIAPTQIPDELAAMGIYAKRTIMACS